MSVIKRASVEDAPAAELKKITPRLVMDAFRKAAKKAVLENDRLGIATPGSIDGKIVWRQPPKARLRQT